MTRIRSPIVFMAIVALLTLGLAAPAVLADPLPGGTLDPTTIDKYAIPLVIPPVMNDENPRNPNQNPYDIAVRQFQQQILPGGIWEVLGFTDNNFNATTVWSYGPDVDSANIVAPDPTSQFNYPAYTIETTADGQVDVRWINDLVDAKGKYLPHLLPVDQTVHWANPVSYTHLTLPTILLV